MEQTREQIAAEIKRFIANADPDRFLIRETCYKTDRFLWLSDNAICESSSKFDSYLYKDRRGNITPLGRLTRYFHDENNGTVFNEPYYLDPDNINLLL